MSHHHCDHLGHTVHVGGRKQSDPKLKHPRFAKFVSSDFVPPAEMDLSPKAAPLLALVLGNDRYGDCVFAAGYHIIGCETSNADDPCGGDPDLTKWALADYSAVTGFDPNVPESDQGTDPASAIAFWKSTGFRDATKLAGYVEVNAANPKLLQQAFTIAGNLFIAMDLPQAWVDAIQTMKSGDVWDKAGPPVPSNGHMVMAVGYNAQGIIIDTWGMGIILTWAAAATYAVPARGGETYALLTPDQVSKAKANAPNGLDWAGIVAAFDGIGGDVPVPAPEPSPGPPPAPPPAPSPVGGVTLSQAIEWASKPFLHHACPNTMSRANALHAVRKALHDNWPKGK